MSQPKVLNRGTQVPLYTLQKNRDERDRQKNLRAPNNLE